MFKTSTSVLALLAIAPLSHAALFVNTGITPDAGIGPNGADANYIAVSSGPHENVATGNLVTVNGVSFAEGGLVGTYDVGIEFTWPDTTALTVRQSFSRANPGYPTFFSDWVGLDSRSSQGGNGTGTTIRLTLTGLEANTDFVLTSYHFDTQDQSSNFKTSLTGDDIFAFGEANGVAGLDTSIYAYDFNLTTDGTGTASIDYSIAGGGSWLGINGFDLVAVPEPSSLALLGLGGLMISRRRRA